MADFSIKLEGSDELIRFFASLPREFGPRVMGDIAQAGATPIRAEARRQLGGFIASGGELGTVSKKAVVIVRPRDNPALRLVTVSNRYIDFRGKPQSIGKIIRHMTAGRQNVRKTKAGYYRGIVSQRGGDFVHTAFGIQRTAAIDRMAKKAFDIIKKRAFRQRGISVR